jgi:hypothetical protein
VDGATHVPDTQFCPTEHAWPQLPQFSGLFCTLTHERPHVVVPAGHDGVHTPPTEHAWPQLPQFSGLFWTLTHERPHVVVPAGHEGVHTPVTVNPDGGPSGEHTSSTGHRLPHPPQLFGSDRVSTQLRYDAPHAWRPLEQLTDEGAHTPAWQ